MERKMTYKLSCRLFTDAKCFGPGVAQLLHAVQQLRSLRAAALSMDMAYSKAWIIVKNSEKALGFPLLPSTPGGKGGGGAALAVNGMLKPYMQQKGIRMGFAIGGIMQAMCDLMDEGFVRKIVDAQVFDAAAIEHIKTNPNHVEISTSEYANPMNKGAYVNKLDFVMMKSCMSMVQWNCI